MVDPSPSPTRRWTARALLVILPPLVLLGLVELALVALGLGAEGRLVGRGFSASGTSFVPDGAAPGAWTTQIFGDPAREVSIPPRDERVRVLIFGGSNAQLLPGWYLQEQLQSRAPGPPGWEVVNLGRQGYGSARVRILLEEALVRLVPDVVVIHSGHNEFVERAFATEVAMGRGPLHGFAEALGGLRVFRVLEESLRPHVAPQDVDPAFEAFHDFTWAQTQEVFAAYRENLAAMCARARDAGAQVVLSTMIGNDWRSPQVSDAGLPDERARAIERTLKAVVKSFPQRSTLFPGGAPLRVRSSQWTSGLDDHPFVAPPVRTLTGFLGNAPALTRGDRDSDSVEGAHWPDPVLWSKPVRVLMNAYSANVHGEPDAGERAVLLALREVLDEILAEAPRHALALFLAGQVATLLGDAERGGELLVRAATFDCAPRRGNPTTNALVREVAAEQEGVILYDAAREFRECSPLGVLGYEVMMDACHLQPGARIAMLERLADVLLAAR